MGARWDRRRQRLSRFYKGISERHPAFSRRVPEVGLALATLGAGGAVGWFSGVTTATAAITAKVDIWTPGSLAFLSGMGLLLVVGLVMYFVVPRPDEFRPVHRTLDDHTERLGRIEDLLTKPVETEIGSSAPNPERNPVAVFSATGPIYSTFTGSTGGGTPTVVPPPEGPPNVTP